MIQHANQEIQIVRFTRITLLTGFDKALATIWVATGFKTWLMLQYLNMMNHNYEITFGWSQGSFDSVPKTNRFISDTNMGEFTANSPNFGIFGNFEWVVTAHLCLIQTPKVLFGFNVPAMESPPPQYQTSSTDNVIYRPPGSGIRVRWRVTLHPGIPFKSNVTCHLMNINIYIYIYIKPSLMWSNTDLSQLTLGEKRGYTLDKTPVHCEADVILSEICCL